MKKIILFLLLTSSNLLTAQNSLAKIEYSYAEEAFNKKEYKKTLKHIEEVKNLLGSTNARVMYLEIKAKELSTESVMERIYRVTKDPNNLKMLEIDPLRDPTNSALTRPNLNKRNTVLALNDWLDSIQNLYTLCDSYIRNFESDVPLEKLKNVYEIKKNTYFLISNKTLIYKTLSSAEKENEEVLFPLLKKLLEINLVTKSFIEITGKTLNKKNFQKDVLQTIENNMVYVEGNSSEINKVKDLYVSKYEVTLRDYYAVNNIYLSKNHKDYQSPHSFLRSRALEFITDLNKLTGKKYRLPTNEEWYWFATGGKKNNDKVRGKNKEKCKKFEDYALFYENRKNSLPQTSWAGITMHQVLVGIKAPNELGLYDVWGSYAELTTKSAIGGMYLTKKKKLVKGDDYTKGYKLNLEKNKKMRFFITVRLVRDPN